MKPKPIIHAYTHEDDLDNVLIRSFAVPSHEWASKILSLAAADFPDDLDGLIRAVRIKRVRR